MQGIFWGHNWKKGQIKPGLERAPIGVFPNKAERHGCSEHVG